MDMLATWKGNEKSINTQSSLHTADKKKRKKRPFSGNFSELDSLVWMLSEREMWDRVVRTQQGYRSLFSLGISVNNFFVFCFFNGREKEWTLKAEQQLLAAAFGLCNKAYSASGYNCKMLSGVKELHPFGTTQMPGDVFPKYVSPCSLFKCNPLCFIYLLQICQQKKVKVVVLCFFFSYC